MADSDEPTGLILESVEHHTCEHCGVEMDVLGVEPFNSFNCPECDAPFTVPARLGPFLLLSQIGRGGMGGVVFLARDELLARNVAIKIMPASVGANQEVVATFRREAQAAARLNHPNIAQVYSFGQENGQPYIVMELLSGSSLDKMIEAQGQMDEGFVIHVGTQIAQGLRAADEASLTHGDIKPENILFDDKMNAKLVDFGIASFVNQASDGIWGTPYYIAPERLLRQRPDARSDMYCLGGTLYHALTGRPPFDGRTPAEVVRARMEMDPAPVKELRRDVHNEVDALVSRMLRRDPALRHPTYASLIGDLTRAAKVVPHTANTASFAATKTGKKIIIAGATGRMAKTAGPSGKTSGSIRVFSKTRDSQRIITKARDSQQVEVKDAEQAAAEAGSHPQAAGRTLWRRLLKAFVWLAILGGLAAGGGWLYLSVMESRSTEYADRKDKVLIKSEQAKVPALWTAMQSAVSNVNRHATGAVSYTGTVVRAVQAVIEEVIEMPPPPGAPASTNEPESATNAAPSAATNAAAGETNVAAAASNQPPAAVAPAEPPPPAAPEHEIKTLGKKALAAVRGALNARDTVERLSREAAADRDKAMAAVSGKVAAQSVNALAGKVEECKNAEADAKRGFEEAKALAAKVDGIRVKTEAAREKAKRGEAERIERERIEREKKEAEARRKALIEAELGTAKGARLRAQAYVQKYAFDKAVEELKADRPKYETDEGKAELDKNIERYQRMAALHRFVIERLNSQPFGWGWISSRSEEDVTGADEKEVRTRTKTYPWSEVSIRQYLHFFKHYADDKNLRAREAADNFVAAAIFCVESVLGSDNVRMVEGARNMAREFADRAKNATLTVEPDIARLLTLE
jgi:serine/threonine protein kinase